MNKTKIAFLFSLRDESYLNKYNFFPSFDKNI